MSKPKERDNSADLRIEVVHVTAADAADRIRTAVEILLAAACRGHGSGDKTQARSNSFLPGDSSGPEKSDGVGP